MLRTLAPPSSPSPVVHCRVCNCSLDDLCDPPCSPEPGDPSLCSSCADAAEALALWWQGARRANRRALWREVERRFGMIRVELSEEFLAQHLGRRAVSVIPTVETAAAHLGA